MYARPIPSSHLSSITMCIAPLPCIQALEEESTRQKNYIASIHMQSFDAIGPPAGRIQATSKDPPPPPPPPPAVEPVMTLVLTGDVYEQAEHDPEDVAVLYGIQLPALVKTEQSMQRMWLRFSTEKEAKTALEQLSAKKVRGELSQHFKAKMATRNYHQPAQEAVPHAHETKKLYVGPIKNETHVDDPTWMHEVFPTASPYQSLSHVNHCRKRATSAFRSNHFMLFHWSCAHPHRAISISISDRSEHVARHGNPGRFGYAHVWFETEDEANEANDKAQLDETWQSLGCPGQKGNTH